MSVLGVPLTNFVTLGELLKFLRRRARLSQRELSIAVGYSESHISRIENGDRPLDRTNLLALFVPALRLQAEPEVVERLLALCAERPAQPSDASTSPHLTAPAPAIPPARTNLPAQLTSFVGRVEEVAEVRDLLLNHTARLLTLTGAGGSGKTRLALRVGEEVVHAYEHGVWLVELAPLSDAHLLPRAIAAVFGLTECAGHPMCTTLIDYLRPRRLLLILDNCEHLVEAAAQMAGALLNTCPRLQILATSRETLAVPGEVNFCALPLGLPPAQQGVQPSHAAVQDYDAIRLFVERARTALHTFVLTDDNAPTVAHICRRLDGIPLGIELAAAWVNTLALEQIAARLDQDLDLLVSGSRASLPRHRTLRAAMEWSYALLLDAERALLRRLSVFAGGWTLDSAEAVASDTTGDAEPASGTVLAVLNRLINKSLVTVEHAPVGGVRYRLLEPIREYLRGKLDESGEETHVRERHLAYFGQLAEVAQSQNQSAPALPNPLDLERELDNLRAALDWSLSHEKAGPGLHLACNLGQLWYRRGHYTEGRRWLQAALAHLSEPSPVRAHALLWAGILARLQGDMIAARPLCDESLALFRASDDTAGAAVALENIGWTEVTTDPQRAAEHFGESLSLFRRLGDRRRSGRVLTTLAQISRENADFDLAARQLHEALAQLRDDGDDSGIALALNGLAELASLAGDYDQTARLLTESLALTEVAGSQQDRAWIECGLAENGWHRGDYPTALQHAQNSLQWFEALGSDTGRAIALHHLGLIWLALDDAEVAGQCLQHSLALCHSAGREFMRARCLAGLAGVALAQDQAKWACQLLSSATACFAHCSNQLTPADTAFYDRLVGECRTRLGGQAFSAAWEHCIAMSVDVIVAGVPQHLAAGRVCRRMAESGQTDTG